MLSPRILSVHLVIMLTRCCIKTVEPVRVKNLERFHYPDRNRRLSITNLIYLYSALNVSRSQDAKSPLLTSALLCSALRSVFLFHMAVCDSILGTCILCNGKPVRRSFRSWLTFYSPFSFAPPPFDGFAKYSFCSLIY